MTPFLQQIARLFYNEYGPRIARLAFVFPNRRAGLFFKKYLSELSDKPLFAPTILTLSDLFGQLTDKQPADRIGMLFHLYNIYVEKSRSTETFDNFFFWGEMLLNDFDEVDKYRVAADKLFTNVTDLRLIEQDFNFLSETQIAAIRTFWSTFHPGANSPNQQEFLAVWEILSNLYSELKQRLTAEGKGYEGMLFREAVEHLEREETFPLPYDKVVFVGLHALSTTEEDLLLELKRRNLADFYWDYASEKTIDPQNKASYFAERNLRQFPSSHPLPPEEVVKTTIDVVGIPSATGQAKLTHQLLEALGREDNFDEEAALRTAIVLPDEHLLLPVLNSIPESFRQINVTMGYPLAGTPVASLMEYVIAMQQRVRYVDEKPAFYNRDVIPILSHRYIQASQPEVVARLQQDITRYNKIYIPADELTETPLLQILFRPVSTVSDFLSYLPEVLQAVNRAINRHDDDETAETDAETRPTSTDIDQEFIFHYFAVVSRIREVINEMGIEMRIDTCFRLIKQATNTIKVPFEGEPLSGLQIMGVLETRTLDFDRLIVLSVNEGVFPSRSVGSSFIPHNLRKGFGLPTYEHQDSLWAYHFYRLIHRASHVSLIYDTRNNGLQNGEVSRFVYQLKYHYQEPLNERLVIYPISGTKKTTLEVAKTPAIMDQLFAFCQGGERALSASAINTYLDCPLKFYFSYVENMEEVEEVNETVGSDVFGSILHKVMEDLYQPLQGKLVTADLLKLIRKDNKKLTETIHRAFAGEYFKTERIRPLTGQNYLIGEMIRKYAKKILEMDGKLTPFHYVESEKRIKCDFALSDRRIVQLKGFIDRIDSIDGTYRIIDYKSGAGHSAFDSVESLFDKEDADRRKAIMQVFMYAWIYGLYPENKERIIRPGIYYVRKLFLNEFDAGIYHHLDRGTNVPVSDFNTYRMEFEENFRSCLDEIFDSTAPFTQTTTGKACGYCAFKEICLK